MVKEIKLVNNKGIVLIDDNDYNFLNEYRWRFSKGGYAKTEIIINKKQTTIGMHRLIMNPPQNMQIDHIDHNGLNNQRDNLRIVTSQQNLMNKLKRKNCSSIFKGVHWNKRDKKWVAQIGINKKIYNIGSFIFETDAAVAYNKKATELFGEYACLNEVNK